MFEFRAEHFCPHTPDCPDAGVFEVMTVELSTGPDGELVVGAPAPYGEPLPRHQAAEAAMVYGLLNEATRLFFKDAAPVLVFVRPVVGS